MTDMMLNKARRYDMPLPPDLENAEAELKRFEEAESRLLNSKSSM